MNTMPTLAAELAAYLAGADAPARGIAGLSNEELTRSPATTASSGANLGRWSVHQVIVHLWHSDLAATHRLTRIAAEDVPLLIAYDETAFTTALDYHAVDVHDACTLVAINRRHTHQLLRGLPETAATRAGVHNQRGLVTLSGMLRLYVQHVDHHMAFIAAKRTAMGKPM